MHYDVLGRMIKVGDVCGFASRRSSQTNLEVVIIREIREDGLKGDKLTKAWARDTGWTVKRVPTHLIVRSKHLIITGLAEKDAVELMKIRSER